jgi:hypothetical protein
VLFSFISAAKVARRVVVERSCILFALKSFQGTADFAADCLQLKHFQSKRLAKHSLFSPRQQHLAAWTDFPAYSQVDISS